MKHTNSDLVTYRRISPNKTNKRNHVIDTITIHCIVGQWTAKQGCDYFANSKVKASPNYVVGKDGSIGLCVEEKDRSWCSSNRDNDNRAITIEVASDTTRPYAVTDEALTALIELVADVCKRNNIDELKWRGDKSLVGQIDKQNMTVHSWFENKDCPGQYLYDRHYYIAEHVNKKIRTSTITENAMQSVSPSNKIDTIKEVQKWVNTNYGLCLKVDGIYGKDTKKALIKILQIELNKISNVKLDVDGVFGRKTRDACPLLRSGSKNDIVKVLQAFLVCNKVQNIYMDGNFGSITTVAVKYYQDKNGLVSDGVVGKNTFSKLCT